MSRAGVDRTGQRFGSIVVIGRAQRPSHLISEKAWWWSYRCDCGRIGQARNSDLVKKTSCPHCSKRQRRTTHGMKGTSIYGVWRNMLDRCTNPNHKSFHHYGGRGIEVAPAWKSFERFYADVPPKPEGRYQLDRIDNEKGYEPGNVRWVTPRRNSRNRRDNKLISWQGKTLCMADWAEETGIPYRALKQRFQKGWTADEALATPLMRKGKRRSDGTPACARRENRLRKPAT